MKVNQAERDQNSTHGAGYSHRRVNYPSRIAPSNNRQHKANNLRSLKNSTCSCLTQRYNVISSLFRARRRSSLAVWLHARPCLPPKGMLQRANTYQNGSLRSRERRKTYDRLRLVAQSETPRLFPYSLFRRMPTSYQRRLDRSNLLSEWQIELGYRDDCELR